MKKITSTVLILMLVLTACTSKETVNLKEELKAEIKAEMEAETKAKNEGKNDSSSNEKEEEGIKTFSQVYVDDLEVAIDYYNDNSSKLTDKEKSDFALAIIKELDKMYINLNDSLGAGEVTEILYPDDMPYPTFNDDVFDFYKFSINEFNINYFEGHQKKYYEILRDDKYFTLAVNIWATEGYLDIPCFSIIINANMYIKLKDIIKIVEETEANSYSIPDFIPNIEFESVDKVINYSGYARVLLNDFSEADEFKDKETWKITLLLPVNFVNNEKVAKRTDVYYQDNLVKGTKVSDKFTLTEDFYYDTDGYTMAYNYSLECNDYVKATLIYNNEWDYYAIRIEEAIFDKNVMINNPLAPNNQEEIDFLREGGTFPINFKTSSIGEDFLFFVNQDKYHYLQGKVYVKSLEVMENEVEGSMDISVNDFIPNDSEFERMNNSSNLEGALTRFANEWLYSLDEQTYIDYSKYHLVVIPEQKSINDKKLGKREVNITDTGKEYPLKFSVLGEVLSLEFTYFENPLDEEKEPKVVKVEGPIKDEIVTVNAYLPTDFSYVGVEGVYVYLSGKDDFEFGLNDVQDPESYKILTFDAR